MFEKKSKYKFLDFSIFCVKIVYLIIVIIALLILCVVKPSTLYFDMILILLISTFIIYLCIKEIKNRNYRINELANGFDSVLKNSLNVIDIPMIIIGDHNKIIWQNNIAKHIIPLEVIHDSALQIDRQINQNQGNGLLSVDIGNGSVYDVIGNNILIKENKVTLLSFINRTVESELRKSLEDTRAVVGILFIDNYEETLQGLDSVNRAEISSMIEKEIRTWVVENNGILNKLDKDKYVLFIEKQYVEQMEKNTFEILERVKNITDKTKLPITISIGMSYSENTLNERYMASSSALDIALGRGGDQVVIKKDKKFDFYGGSNLGLEKTSRVRARTISQALKELMLKCDKVYIMGHKNTDIDCIGASVGVYKIARSLNKEAYIVTDTKFSSSTKLVVNKLKELDSYKNAFVTKDDIKKNDYASSLLVIVDTHKKSYLAYPDLLESIEKKVVIDHHRRGPEFIDDALLTYHEIYASSSSELVTEILMYLDNIELSSVEAEAIYSGIVVDTKNFTFKTGVRTFEVAAYLKKYGLDLTEVKQIFKNDFATYVAKVDIVKKAEILKGTIAISTTEENYDDMPVIAAQAADELLNITGILASFVLCKVEDVVMISGRSMGDINVQAILEKVGGGGHLTFAGAQLVGITIDEAKEKLIQSINEYFGNE